MRHQSIRPLPTLLLATVAAIAVLSALGSRVQADDAPTTVYELRTYTTAEGKLPDLHARFKNHTMSLFEKHGMQNVMYWTPIDTPNTLVYLLAHKSREAAKESWESFRNDPEWKKVFAESRKDGRLVIKVESQFLAPTEYSPQRKP